MALFDIALIGILGVLAIACLCFGANAVKNGGFRKTDKPEVMNTPIYNKKSEPCTYFGSGQWSKIYTTEDRTCIDLWKKYSDGSWWKVKTITLEKRTNQAEKET